jgi:hypothetical protein
MPLRFAPALPAQPFPKCGQRGRRLARVRRQPPCRPSLVALLSSFRTAPFVPRGALRRPRRVLQVRTDPPARGRWSADRRTRLFHRACEARSAALARHGPSRCNRDALSALHRGDFRPGTRAAVSGSGTGADQRSARCRAMRPGGRGPGPPALRFRAASRRTPRLAPPAGSSPETPLMSEDTNLV